jgi:RNA polymerase sigma-70 factor (ECF subfamily)
VHADAAIAGDTDWSQIVQLYDQLIQLTPTPIVALNRAIAIAELDGPEPALAILDGLDLQGYHLYHAARAELLHQLGKYNDAAVAYERALSLTTNAVEQDHLRRRRDTLPTR